MKRRILLAALAAAAAVPAGATPASAHGYCGFDYNTGSTSLQHRTYTAYLYCDTMHATYDITVCLDWAPVSGEPAGVQTPYVTTTCKTTHFVGWASGPHWLVADVTDDCRPGFYRGRAEAVMDGGHVVAYDTGANRTVCAA